MKFRRARLQAVFTGKGKTAPMGAVEAYERNVLAITRRIHTLALKRAALAKQIAAVKIELRAKRRELRAVLQRDQTMTIETADERLAEAGAADAIDAVTARHERGSK